MQYPLPPKKLEKLRAEAEKDPTALNFYNLGINLIIYDRKKGEEYVNQAIQMGILEQQVMSIVHTPAKNRNPLYQVNQQLKT